LPQNPDTKLGGGTEIGVAFQLVNDNGFYQDDLVVRKDCCSPLISAALMSLWVLWITGLGMTTSQPAILSTGPEHSTCAGQAVRHGANLL
jgi:hypothetical protein